MTEHTKVKTIRLNVGVGVNPEVKVKLTKKMDSNTPNNKNMRLG